MKQFKVDEFKVGERVAFSFIEDETKRRFRGEMYTATVIMIKRSDGKLFRISIFNCTNIKRLVKKKKRRVIWVNEYPSIHAGKVVYGHAHQSLESALERAGAFIRTIKFVESK